MPEKVFYAIAGEEFSNKDGIKVRCREIIAKIADGQPIPDEDLPFLIELFQHHDEWGDKALKGIKKITVQRTGQYATRCFMLLLSDNTIIDISFNHAIKLLRGERTKVLQPQRLVDYKNAARTAVTEDVRAFRDAHLALKITCPFSGDLIVRENCAVDHEPPLTFDKLLYDFTANGSINPLQVAVGSRDGTTAYFESMDLATNWIDYHRLNSRLRLLSTIGHAQVSVPRIDWAPLITEKKL
ncbi:MAG: DUF3223 domain-containing protein [Candidatus Peribacter sp.]|nr:DUF3223 domain-containing protein [Candidatus Peribacter sp.]